MMVPSIVECLVNARKLAIGMKLVDELRALDKRDEDPMREKLKSGVAGLSWDGLCAALTSSLAALSLTKEKEPGDDHLWFIASALFCEGIVRLTNAGRGQPGGCSFLTMDPEGFLSRIEQVRDGTLKKEEFFRDLP